MMSTIVKHPVISAFATVFLAFLIAVSVMSCTQNARTRMFGGKMTYNIPKGEKLVIVTWKDSDMWVLTRPMKPTDSVETYKFAESSNFGVFEGTLTLIETR